MKLQSYLAQWEKDVESFLGAIQKPDGAGNYTRADIKTGIDAWSIAHKVGICATAYNLPRSLGVNDAHIQTALEALFPNAVFRDAKRY